jgi:hypothetical protein
MLNFWAKVDKNGPIPVHKPELGPCWVWTGYKDDVGYGRFRCDGQAKLSHRVAWLLTYGVWPAKNALHKCDNPPCVNPSHLFEGNQKTNMQDCAAKGRMDHKGEKHNLAKLNDKNVIIIRDSFLKGTSRKDLALQFGVSRSTIQRVVNREYWPHVI